jgi:hypothetical protein
MRKVLLVILAVAVLWALSTVNTRRSRARYPFLRRLDDAINILAAVLLAAWLAGFVYWLLKR